MRLFLSYRRLDVGGYAGRLHDALAQRLGDRNVFQDVTAIAPGKDFAEAIRRALDDCDAVLAIIGPGWVGAEVDGAPRLHQPDDYVRLEVATALTHDLPVVPVLVGGASLPSAAELPDDLKALVQRQAVVIRNESWRQDVDGLVRSLRAETSPPRVGVPRRKVVAVLAALAVLAGGVLAWTQWSGGNGNGRDEEARTIGPCGAQVGDRWQELTTDPDAVIEARSGEKALAFRVRRASWRPIAPGRWEVVLQTSMENRSTESAYHGDWHYDGLLVARREFEKTCFAATPEVVIPDAVGDGVVSFEVGCDPTAPIELLVSGSRGRVTEGSPGARC